MTRLESVLDVVWTGTDSEEEVRKSPWSSPVESMSFRSFCGDERRLTTSAAAFWAAASCWRAAFSAAFFSFSRALARFLSSFLDIVSSCLKSKISETHSNYSELTVSVVLVQPSGTESRCKKYESKANWPKTAVRRDPDRAKKSTETEVFILS